MFKRLMIIVLLTFGIAGSMPLTAASLQAAPTPMSPLLVQVIEYYRADLDHYFITADADEAAALDSGVFWGWTRAGYQFTAYSPATLSSSLSAVCRFYGRPEAGLDSHFYSGSPDECAAVIKKFAASWQFESSNVFQVQMPDLGTGSCPVGAAPVYRLFNNRLDANHRYTTDASVKQAMVSRGYASEGYGPDGVAFCSANPSTSTTSVSPTTGAPSASIFVTQMAPDTFDFGSSATASTGVSIVSYAWDFGDGGTGTGSTSSHRFTLSGTYPVTLTVTDSKSAVATATKSVTAAAPTVTPGLPMVGSSNRPDIFELEMVDEATIEAAVGPGNIAQPFANEPEFGIDPQTGLRYLRFASWTDSTRLISWCLPFAARDQVSARYCLYLEGDIAAGMTELGVKLPGLRASDDEV